MNLNNNYDFNSACIFFNFYFFMLFIFFPLPDLRDEACIDSAVAYGIALDTFLGT